MSECNTIVQTVPEDNNFDGPVTAEAFYMSSGGDLSAITRNLTLQNPARREVITFFSAEANFRVTRMRAILRADDNYFYPGIDFSLRFNQNFPSMGSGTELTSGGFSIDFYPNEASLDVSTFTNSIIPKNSWVTLETLALGEGEGVERELAVSLFLERS